MKMNKEVGKVLKPNSVLKGMFAALLCGSMHCKQIKVVYFYMCVIIETPT